MKRLKGIEAVITDADNTLYNWIEYIVPCLEAMVDTLCRVTGYGRDEIVASMKEVFGRRGTNEYAFVLQEAEIFKGLRRDPERFQERVIRPARFAFNRARKKYLRLYPGVTKTLRTLCNHGVRVFVLSDAPAFPAEQRIKHLGIARYISALYALRSYPLPDENLLDRRIINRIRTGYYRSRIGKIVEMPLEFEKPNPEGIRMLLREENLSPRKVMLVGDNLKKDILIARKVGVADIWARYGTIIRREMLEKLNYYSAPEIQRRNLAQPGKVSYEPTWTIDRFDQILLFFRSDDERADQQNRQVPHHG